MFRKLKIIVFVLVILFGFSLVQSANALTLGISGNNFTLDGTAKFLTFVSYFDAIRAPDGTLDSDLAYLKSKGIDGIRIFPNWWGTYSNTNPPNDTLMDPSNGTLRPAQLAKLKSVIEKANSKGLVVDVSFAREIEPGFSIANYKKAIVSAVQALSGYKNIFYDIQNEYNCNGLSDGDISDIRNAIKGTSSSALVSASDACGASPSQAVSIANSANLDIINYHDQRTSDWYSQTGARIGSIISATKPIYFGEPEKWTSGSGLIADNFITAVTQAKSAGAAAWTFHTKAAYNLGANSIQSSLDAGVEKKFLDTFYSKLSTTTWGSGSSGSGSSGNGESGTGTGGENTDPVIPPIPEDTGEIPAVSGWAGNLAYNSTANNWLVVSQNNKNINAQVMSNDGKKIGTLTKITTAGENLAPRAGYSPDINKFLVVWVKANTTTNLSIMGQFVNPDGTISGSPIQIDRGNFRFTDNTSVEYDSKNKQFVLAWENTASGVIQVAVNTLSTTGQPGTRINIVPNSGASNGAPSVAVNTQDNQYCVMYQHYGDPGDTTNASKVAVVPISATSRQLGQSSNLTVDSFFTYNIAYNSIENNYLGIWSDFVGTGLYGKIFSGCKDDPNADIMLIGEQYHAANLAYNSKSNSYAIVVQEANSNDNHLYVIDSNGGSIYDGIVFTGSTGGNFGPKVAANTTTGMYAAITSADHANTKFSSNLGGSDLLMPQGGGAKPFPPQTTLPVPDKGLPTDLGQLISAIFVWSLGIIGLVIFVRFFYAGFLWFTAAGSTDRTSRATTIMKNAVYGALVLFSAYLILYTINPDLVGSKLTLPGLPASQPATNNGTGTAVTCNNGVCSNGFIGPCRTPVDCQPVPVTCNNGVCSNGFIGPCQTAAQCQPVSP